MRTKAKPPEEKQETTPDANKPISLKNIAAKPTNATIVPAKTNINIRAKAIPQKQATPSQSSKPEPVSEEVELKLLALFEAPMKTTKAERQARREKDERDRIEELEKTRAKAREKERAIIVHIEQELESDFQAAMETDTDTGPYFEPEKSILRQTPSEPAPSGPASPKRVSFGPSDVKKVKPIEYKREQVMLELSPLPDSELLPESGTYVEIEPEVETEPETKTGSDFFLFFLPAKHQIFDRKQRYLVKKSPR